ncbi:MAG: PTS glucitol/sorbitol transporter subunit IIA [Oscillospiraceae bacterium]|nr:PTS glucitol/sorbitol transporter subunit IIA [Oscillospiraceae bacterium]
MDYKTRVTKIGDMVADFISQQILIVYNDNCPPELAELSVCHTVAELARDVRPGDVVFLGDKDYVVTAVGGEANHTLSTMGHCTLSFKGQDTVELPGHIELSGDGMPEVNPGDPFEILFT